jgi:GNAT superfamily N-acetyltransferase
MMGRLSVGDMAFRIVTLTDRPDLLGPVAAWIYGEWWSHLPGQSPENLAAMLLERRSSDRICESFVAIMNSVPVGTVTVLDHDIHTERWPELTPWIAAVYTVPEARRQGIADKLVSRATAFVKSRGVKNVYLWTTDRGEWYRRLGWEFIEYYDRDHTRVSLFKFDLNV